ncbi:hypothetical protein Srufu_006100 [Streptomyces libani subsp. rufus]|nr:hypothetical protein Srufu_006100 [Streptomyces libani subsp. rufus]
MVDSSHVRALKGGSTRARRRSTGVGPARNTLSSPTATAPPLAVLLTGGNRNDVTQLLPLLDAIPPVRGRVGRPRRKPDSLFADRGYDHDMYRDQVRARGIVSAIARRGTRHGTGLGTYRWVVPDDPPGHARAQGAGAAADDAVARRSGEGAQTVDSTSPVPVAALTTAQG